ncbi:hypothetical protein, partial [Hymenobacter edaphi]|uniref:hypothetical protein n=1 Tax=Hymenobacter edaphi TaxID=2211146 RepID=UPI001A9E66CA
DARLRPFRCRNYGLLGGGGGITGGVYACYGGLNALIDPNGTANAGAGDNNYLWLCRFNL